MPELQTGDEIIIETQTMVLTYVLDTGGDDLVVDLSEYWVTAPLPVNPDVGELEPTQQIGQRLITLTTCAGLFHTDDRMVAFGHLESVRNNTDDLLRVSDDRARRNPGRAGLLFRVEAFAALDSPRRRSLGRLSIGSGCARPGASDPRSSSGGYNARSEENGDSARTSR